MGAVLTVGMAPGMFDSFWRGSTRPLNNRALGTKVHPPNGGENASVRVFRWTRTPVKSIQLRCPGAANSDKTDPRIGPVAFVHRFGSSLNEYVRFHVCVVDGVFVQASCGTDAQSSPPGIVIYPASAIDETAVA